ncbi:MAG: 3'(2'),5'-bisphosphate nucleotidase CysQ [Pseudomonadota bacterium]
MQNFLDVFQSISLHAGKEIMDIYQTAFEAQEKADGSAVTEADVAGEKIICQGLQDHFPDIPILAEEAAANGQIPELGDQFFLVDPLDGTREFVNRTGEFTVNIALIENGHPVAGIVLAPASYKVWWGAKGVGAYCQEVAKDHQSVIGEPTRLSTRPRPEKDLIAVASRSHRSPETEDFLNRLGATDFRPAGSSLKFCLVAEGHADVYPRLGRTMEWDTGAGQAVLEAAGGHVHMLAGFEEEGPLLYGKKERGYDNPHFIAWGG